MSVLAQELTGRTKIYIDKDGAGRLYIPKRIIEALKFEHGEELCIKAENDVLIISKAEKKEPSIVVVRLTDEELRNLSDILAIKQELDKLKKEIEALKSTSTLSSPLQLFDFLLESFDLVTELRKLSETIWIGENLQSFINPTLPLSEFFLVNTEDKNKRFFSFKFRYNKHTFLRICSDFDFLSVLEIQSLHNFLRNVKSSGSVLVHIDSTFPYQIFHILTTTSIGYQLLDSLQTLQIVKHIFYQNLTNCKEWLKVVG